MEALIERLDRWLAENRPDFYAQLLPGVSDDALDQFATRFALDLPTAFRQLYRWRDGQHDPWVPLRGGRSLMSLMDGITWDKGMTMDLIDRPRLVPFLRGPGGGGDYLCLDLQDTVGGRDGQIVSRRRNRSHGVWVVEFPSLEAWLADTLAALEGGWWQRA